MRQEQLNKIGVVDPETGDQYALDVTGELFEDGENWSVKFSATTTKTQFLLFELARFVATKDNPENEAVKDARRILQTVYKKLEFFTVEEKEDKTSILCQWIAKAEFRGADVDREMSQIMELPIFKAVLKHVFGIAKKPDEIQTSKGGGGIRIASEWTQARYRGGMGARKGTAEEMQMEFVLLKLLRDHSAHRDSQHPLYLLGNGGENRMDVSGILSGPEGRTLLENEQMFFAVLNIPKTELYKEYTGKKSALISSVERARVNRLLDTMSLDLISVWDFRQKQQDGTIKWLRVKNAKKIEIIEGADNLTQSESDAIDRGEEPTHTRIIIRFHPAFTYEIKEKYASFPDDYIPKMRKTIGGVRSGNEYWYLVEYLNSIRCGGNKATEADFDTLAEKLDLVSFTKKQGKMATRKKIEAAADAARQVGLLLSWALVEGARKQDKYIFKFNPNFSKG